MANVFRTKQPTQAAPPPPVPTIDEAAMREENTRKFGRRKGFKANLYGGASQGAGQPNVNAKTLLG